MKYYRFFVGFYLILFFSTYTKGQDQQSSQLVEKSYICAHISLGDTFCIEEYALDTLQAYHNPSASISSKGYKIITILDGECSFCTAKLNVWELFIASFDKFPIYAIAIGHAAEIVSFRIKTSDFQQTVIFSSNERLSRFISLEHSVHCSTFLLDTDNIVRLLGNPTEDEHSLNEYKEFYRQEFVNER